jgi:hypothetical protein
MYPPRPNRKPGGWKMDSRRAAAPRPDPLSPLPAVPEPTVDPGPARPARSAIRGLTGQTAAARVGLTPSDHAGGFSRGGRLHPGYRHWTHMGSAKCQAVLVLSGRGYAAFHVAVNFRFTEF